MMEKCFLSVRTRTRCISRHTVKQETTQNEGPCESRGSSSESAAMRYALARGTGIFLALVKGRSAFSYQRHLSTVAPFGHGFHFKKMMSSLSTSSTEEDKITVTDNGVYIVKSMPPPIPSLRNTYYLLRHGQSWGNVEAVISSARSLATSEKHGLTPLGYEQGRESAKNLIEMIASDNQEGDNEKNKRVFFYSSPFARARQTAQACLEGLAQEENKKKANELGLDIQTNVILEDGIMER